MGLPSIDESLEKLLAAMSSAKAGSSLGYLTYTAKALGTLIALCMGSYEAWMMMLGRRGMDVMKILRIVGFALCITFSSSICSALQSPGKTMETLARKDLSAQNKQVADKEAEIATLQSKYLDKLRTAMDSVQQQQRAVELGDDPAWYEELSYAVSHMSEYINDALKKATVLTETKISEYINDVIRFIGQLLFQIAYFGMLVAQRCFMQIMRVFCPVMFALSLAPPWHSAWSQWVSKYVSLSLWGWVVYVIMMYVNQIILYSLGCDEIAYTELISKCNGSWEQLGALGLQGIGTTCFYAMGMMVGVYIIRFVPEVASWLIPGGISSGVGSMSPASVNQATSAATSAAGWAGTNSARALKANT
jgi:hypothetical protein